MEQGLGLTHGKFLFSPQRGGHTKNPAWRDMNESIWLYRKLEDVYISLWMWPMQTMPLHGCWSNLWLTDSRVHWRRKYHCYTISIYSLLKTSNVSLSLNPKQHHSWLYQNISRCLIATKWSSWKVNPELGDAVAQANTMSPLTASSDSRIFRNVIKETSPLAALPLRESSAVSDSVISGSQ